MKTRSNIFLSIMLCIVSLLTCGCGHDTESLGREPQPGVPGENKTENEETPSGSQRPNVTSEVNFAKELADVTWRYVGNRVTMCYDRGGVLFKTFEDGRYEIIDFDSSSKIDLRFGEMRQDSTFVSPCISIDGTDVDVVSVKMKKQTAGAVWYHIVDRESHDIFVVLP